MRSATETPREAPGHRGRVIALAILAVVVALLVHESGMLRSVPRRTRSLLRQENDLVVATFNPNFGLAGDRETLDAMAATNADLVVLQESNEDWALAIAGAHRGRFPHMAFRHPDGRPAGGLGVLSRWPLEILGESPSDGGFFVAWRLLVYTPRGPVQVLDVHLRPQVTDEGSFVLGRFTTGPLREREMRAHLTTLDPSLPTIVLGDFNEEDGAALALVRAEGLRDAAAEHAPGVPTWRWPVGPVTLRQTFDHVLFSTRDFECLDAYVLDAGRSDHQPVIAHLVRARAESGVSSR